MSSATSSATPFDVEATERKLAERCREAVRLALAAGAQEAEAYATRGRETTVGMEKGDLQLARSSSSGALGLRVVLDGRLGFAASNRGDAGALERLAENAVGLARIAPPDEHNGLPPSRPLAPRLNLYREELGAFPVERAVEIAGELLQRTAGADPRVSVDSGNVSSRVGSAAIVSSTGVDAVDTDGMLGFQVFGMAIDGEDVGGFDVQGGSLRDVDALEPELDRAARAFLANVLGNLGVERAESYQGPVLFSPEAFQSVCVGPLIAASSSIAVQRGRSYLAGRVGEAVAHESLNLIDDPSDTELAGAATFDREGLPCTRFPIVEGGVLRSLLYNGYSARVDGVQSTGHAAGGTRAVPGIGTHAIVVEPGSGGDEQAMLERLGRGLYVQRFSGTTDAASGDFSGVAKSARWVEGGRIVRSVGETLLSGNSFAALAEDLHLSSERRNLFGSCRMPWALLSGISVTAG